MPKHGLKVAICDDCPADRDYIAALVKRWAAERERAVAFSIFESAEEFLFHYEENKEQDILLLDIEMGKMDGVALAKELRRQDENMQLIFITGYSDYIAEGYEVAALHYLLKPVQGEKLFSVLDRAVEKLNKNERMLHLTLNGEAVRVPLRQVRYIDVNGNYATVHAKEDYTLKKTLRELEEMLDERFFRAGRSAIVNLTYISRVTKTDIYLADGTAIPLPRGAYEGINRAIIAME